MRSALRITGSTASRAASCMFRRTATRQPLQGRRISSCCAAGKLILRGAPGPWRIHAMRTCSAFYCNVCRELPCWRGGVSMAQHKQLTWTELRVGLFTLAGIVLVVVVIFYVTGAGGGLGPKYRLHAFLPEVDGLTMGAPVRVDGVDVGNVEKIIIAPPKPGQQPVKERSIEVDLRIQKTFQDYIRADSA